MWVLSLLLGLLVVLAITAATGYFVAQEFAYMAVDRSRLRSRAAEGDAAAERALAVTGRTSFMLSGAQLGITVTALLVGYVAEPLIGESLGEAFGLAGVPTGVGLAIGTVLALLLSTFVQMLFGELFPKNLAISRPEPVALWLARSTTMYLRVFGWLISFSDRSSNVLLRAFGMEPVHDVEHAVSRRDLEHIVSESRESGDLPAELSVLLDRVLDFPDRDAEHAMVPRARVDVVSGDLALTELWSTMAGGHSRYPVVDTAGDVVGVVHLTDLLDVADRDQGTVADIMTAPVLVPASMTLPRVLQTLTERRSQLACVLDEHGGLDGVITIEDLAEELVGEIEDEHDEDAEVEQPVAADGTRALTGALPLDEVEREIGHDLPETDVETLGGLVIEVLGELPEVGARASVDTEHARVHLEVLEVERHVPSLVAVRVEEVDPEAADPEDLEDTDETDAPDDEDAGDAGAQRDVADAADSEESEDRPRADHADGGDR